MTREMDYDEFLDYSDNLVAKGAISSTNKDDLFWSMLGYEKPDIFVREDIDNYVFLDYISKYENYK